MPATFLYDRFRYLPPAPVVPVTFSVPGETTPPRTLELMALCDTGADITCVPTRLVADLGLFEVDEIEVSGYEGEPDLKSVYAVQLQIGGGPAQIAMVIGGGSDGALLGRDVLNSFRIEFDGPKAELTFL
jgi:predicted aspartyl protease